MMHELFILGLPCGERKDMTEADAAARNRDLYLAGKRSQGWKPVTPEPRPEVVVPKPVAATVPKPPKPERNEELEAALVALGFKKGDAKRRAASAPAGTLQEQLAGVFAKP